MNISSKAEYGIRAMVEIAGAGAAVKRDEISRRQAIPLPFLTQVLRALVNSGLVKSSRGPDGGYLMTKSPSDVSLLDIVTALQGPIVPRGCLDVDRNDACLVGDGDCLLRDVWSALKSANEAILKSVALSDLGSVKQGGWR